MSNVLKKRPRGRPPKSSKNTISTRKQLLRAGVASLTEKGFVATGLEEILRVVNVPKGSFYHYFASKEAFGLELIAAYDAYFVKRLERILNDKSMPVLSRFQEFFTESEQGMARYDFNRGCLVGNLGQEMMALPTSFREQLINVLRGWEQRFELSLVEAKKAQEIGAHIDCKKMAHFFWIGWEGAVLRAKLEKNAHPLQIFGESYLASLR